MKKLIAYNNDPTLKNSLLKEVEKHRKADRIVQGSYGDSSAALREFRGCAVGCSIYSLNKLRGLKVYCGDHTAYETYFGIPVELAVLEDRIFERLSVDDAKLWPGQFLGAIQPGADLSLVFPQLYYWIWTDEKLSIMRHIKDEELLAACKEGIALFARWSAGDKPSETEFREASEKLRALARALDLARARALDLARARALDLARALALDLARALALDLARARALDLDLDLDLARDLDRALDIDREKFYAAVAAKMVELLAAAPIAEVVE
ncbi:hypothetical protein BH09VER1_BH09VER1_24930 [soil metagenome]